jgi:putative oxidoreductase
MDNQRMNQMTLLSRLLISLIFIVAGTLKIFSFAGTTGYIASKGLPMPQVLTALAIVVELGGGLALAFGYCTKWAAYTLAGFSLLAAIFFHNFWAGTGAAMQNDLWHFLKNLALIGGLLLFATYGPGTYAVGKKAAA